MREMIDIEGLANAFAAYLENYSQEVTDGIKKAAGVVAAEVNEEIKSHISFKQNTGKYVKAFRIKKDFETKYNVGYVWHVVNDQYRLTHLLEKGHALSYGGRARAYPHIKFGEELAIKRMEELAKGAIEDAGN